MPMRGGASCRLGIHATVEGGCRVGRSPVPGARSTFGGMETGDVESFGDELTTWQASLGHRLCRGRTARPAMALPRPGA